VLILTSKHIFSQINFLALIHFLPANLQFLQQHSHSKSPFNVTDPF